MQKWQSKRAIFAHPGRETIANQGLKNKRLLNSIAIDRLLFHGQLISSEFVMTTLVPCCRGIILSTTAVVTVSIGAVLPCQRNSAISRSANDGVAKTL